MIRFTCIHGQGQHDDDAVAILVRAATRGALRRGSQWPWFPVLWPLAGTFTADCRFSFQLKPGCDILGFCFVFLIRSQKRAVVYVRSPWPLDSLFLLKGLGTALSARPAGGCRMRRATSKSGR